MSDDTTPPKDPNAGSTPPPPPPPGDGGPGAMPPPPPPPPAYGAPPAAGGAYSPVEAMSYGWAKFTKSPATLLIPVLLMVVAIGIVYAVMFFGILASSFDSDTTINADGSIDYDAGPGFFLTMVLMGIIILVVITVMQIFMAALVKGALDVTDGKSPSLGDLFQGWDKTQVVIAALLVAVGTAVGSILCYIPGLIFGFLAGYTMYYVVDKNMSAVDAIKASISFTTSHLSETLLFFLLMMVAVAVGGILCGIGLLVAYPVVLVGQAYTFRVLNNEPVTPAA